LALSGARGAPRNPLAKGSPHPMAIGAAVERTEFPPAGVQRLSRRTVTPSILDEGSKSSRSPLHTLRRHSKYELSRQFISCVVQLQNHISPTTIPPIGTGRTIRLFIPRNQCPTLQFRYCFWSCKELSFLQFAVGFVVNYKHSATIPSGKAIFQQLTC
jgi:hypothetical protein